MSDESRLFAFDRVSGAVERNVELVRDFAAHDAFRSAMVEELELDEDFYRRPLRPEDLSFIKFTEPVAAATMARLPFLASQRMLLCINELQIARLPRDGEAESFAECTCFYGDDSQVLGAQIRPLLENFSFDFLCAAEARAPAKGDLKAQLQDLLAAESAFWNDVFARLSRAGYHDDGLRFVLLQKWCLQPSKKVALAKAAALGYFDALPTSDRPRLDRPDGVLAGELATRLGIGKREHSYWQFYLSTSLAECNLLHALASRPDRALALCGAAFAAEIVGTALGGVLAQAAPSLGIAARNDADTTAKDGLARFARALDAVANRYGNRGLSQMGQGLAAAVALAAAARQNLGEQLRWLASVERYRDIAQTISARIAAECPNIDRETFVEPREMCSTTHVHDDHRLVVIETGNMVFWGNLGMKLRLAPGEMVLVPEGRLHGSSIESEECVYHQPIIPDSWVRPLISNLDASLGA
jgi:hypothetical protein